jgi:predicted porin
MKRTLFATTALATAGLLAVSAGDAFAQAAAPAAEKLKISVGGYMNQYVGWAEQDDDFEKSFQAATRQERKGFDTKQDSELYFSGSVKLDNGMSIGIMTQLETQRSTGATGDFIDESYMTIGTGFGDVKLGSTDSVGGTLGVQAPFVAFNNPATGDQGAWIVAPSASLAGAGGTNIGGADDSNKITYISPSLAGFRAGLTYIPSATNSENQPTIDETDTYNLAAQYGGKFGDVGLRGSVQWWTSNAATQTASTNNWSVGADVTFADITIGAGFLNTEGVEDAVAGGSTSADLWAYNVGIKYSPGPWSIGLHYAHREADDTVGDTDEDSHDRVTLGAQYTLGPGVTAGVDFFHHKFQDELDTNATENSGWALVGGIGVSF